MPTLEEMQAEMRARVSGNLESGRISRCPHSIYIPAGDKKAIYCRICTPEGPDAHRATPAEAPKKRRKTKATGRPSSTFPVLTPELSQTV